MKKIKSKKTKIYNKNRSYKKRSGKYFIFNDTYADGLKRKAWREYNEYKMKGGIVNIPASAFNFSGDTYANIVRLKVIRELMK